MAESIVIICEESPIGKNSVIESIRMATGILAVGDIENCKVILMGDAIYFFNRNLNPEILNIDKFSDIMRLIDFSEIEIYVLDEALNVAGMDHSDLISYDHLKVVNMNDVSKLILEADMCFRY
ncbi:MAG: DsrE family protein [Candidatus Thorarchaeota archaeon]